MTLEAMLGIAGAIVAALAGVVGKLYTDLRVCEKERREEAAGNQKAALENQKIVIEAVGKLLTYLDAEQRRRGGRP